VHHLKTSLLKCELRKKFLGMTDPSLASERQGPVCGMLDITGQLFHNDKKYQDASFEAMDKLHLISDILYR